MMQTIRIMSRTFLPLRSSFSHFPCLSVVNPFCSSTGDKPSESDVKSSNNKNEKSPPVKPKRLPNDQEMKNFKEVLTYEFHRDADDMVPRHTDVLIIGGGIMGWSAAYHLTNMVNVDVTVVERDPSYTRSSTVLGIGGLRQQFSEPENVHMSLVGAHFLRTLREHLCVDDEDTPDIKFNPHGFLVTASESGAEQLEKNFQMQQSMGARVEMLSPTQLKDRWPWMNTEDLACATYGFENEGWFDPWVLLSALRKKASTQHVNFVEGELVGFEFMDGVTSRVRETIEYDSMSRVHHALVRTADGNIHPIHFAKVINAAGPWAGEVARRAGIGLGGVGGVLPVPVEPRIQQLFTVRPQWRAGTPSILQPSIDTPWILDYQGAQFRRESLGGEFITWTDPPPPLRRSVFDGDQDKQDALIVQDLEVDYQWFHERILPQLKQRIPCLESAQIRAAWAGFYDYNFVDQNLIIGNHPGMNSFFFLNGSSGHGIQHAIAAGLSVAELIIYGRFKTVDLSRFTFDRFYEKIYVKEKQIS